MGCFVTAASDDDTIGIIGEWTVAIGAGGGRTVMEIFNSEWGRDAISPPRMFCVTVNVLPVSSGTVQLTGSGERTTNCSGDLTRVGSGSALIKAGNGSCSITDKELAGSFIMTFSFPSSAALLFFVTLTGSFPSFLKFKMVHFHENALLYCTYCTILVNTFIVVCWTGFNG